MLSVARAATRGWSVRSTRPFSQRTMGRDLRDTKGLSRKARDDFRKAHPQVSRSRSGSRDSNKGNKNKDNNCKSMRAMLEADDHDSDDSDSYEGPRAPFGCLRTSHVPCELLVKMPMSERSTLLPRLQIPWKVGRLSRGRDVR